MPRDWSSTVRASLCQATPAEEWTEFSDVAQRRYRAACLQQGQLQACIFTDATPDIIERDWLAQLFTEESLGRLQRNALLAGSMPGAVHDHGPIVCSCYSIGLRTIQEAIATRGLVTVEAIGQAIRAGTNCGSCKPELSRILKQAQRQSAA
jgi:assimilatory nitrate reductase catalytic subunit